MSLPRSSYYYRPGAPRPDDPTLVGRIEALVEEFAGYGYRRVTAQLHREGFRVNHKKVLRLMRERGWLCRPRRHRVCTTDSTHAFAVYPNLLPDRPATTLNQVLVADMTYIRLRSAFVYLAVILDRCSRRAIGYALSHRIDTTLCLRALQIAIAHRRPPPGVIHHSDRGVQYAAQAYVQTLQVHGFQISMARKGNPYDNANAAAESFMKTLKTEEVYLWEYRTIRRRAASDSVLHRAGLQSETAPLSPGLSAPQ
jgi:putative transposase